MQMGGNGTIEAIRIAGNEFIPALPFSYFEIDEAIATVESATSNGWTLVTEAFRARVEWQPGDNPRFCVVDAVATGNDDGKSLDEARTSVRPRATLRAQSRLLQRRSGWFCRYPWTPRSTFPSSEVQGG